MILFLLQLRGELAKLFGRKRSYLGFGTFFVVEVLVLFFFQLRGPKMAMQRTLDHSHVAFGHYFSGPTLAMLMLQTSIFFLGALFLGLVGGDLVAKEVEEGTMRMTLCRPISRLRILFLKYCTCVIYTFTLVTFVGISALAVAVMLRGTGGLFAVNFEEKFMVFYDIVPGLERYFGALPAIGLSFLTVSTFYFHLSCWNVKPAAATIAAIGLFFADWIIHMMPFFESYKPWLITTHMTTWFNVLHSPIPWQQMVEDYAYLLGLDATLLVIAVVVFQSRDFKS